MVTVDTATLPPGGVPIHIPLRNPVHTATVAVPMEDDLNNTLARQRPDIK